MPYSSTTQDRQDASSVDIISNALRIVLNAVSHMIVGLVVFFIIYFAAYLLPLVYVSDIRPFHIHIILSVIGYQLLLVEAILSFNKDGPLGAVIPRKHKGLLHGVLAGLGAGFSVAGTITGLVANRDSLGGTSAHGACALIALSFTLISCINGLLAFFSPRLRDKVKPAYVKALHTVSGSLAVIMGLVTLCIGINRTSVVIIGRPCATGLTVLIALALVYTLIMPMISLKGYLNNMRATVL